MARAGIGRTARSGGTRLPLIRPLPGGVGGFDTGRPKSPLAFAGAAATVHGDIACRSPAG